MPRSNLELPRLPDTWRDTPASSAEAPAPTAGPGLLDGVSVPDWSPQSSALNLLLTPEEMAHVDFSGAHDGGVQPLPSGKDSSGGQSDARARGDWAQLPQPADLEAGEHGSGYYTYGTDQTGRPGTAASGQWGMPRAMEVIGAVADRLAVGDRYTPFGVGNISLQDGGSFPKHKSHMDGLGIDVRPARSDGAQLPVIYQNQLYDRAATQRLIDAFRATGHVDKIFFNDPQMEGVQPLEGHDNHFHVQLKR